MLTLKRLTEVFTAAAMSIQSSRPFDGVCIVVTGVIAAIADATIRRLATDRASEVPFSLSFFFFLSLFSFY